jgi:hypothetical protein
VTFTPTDSDNYTSASATVSLAVSKAPLTVRADDKTSVLGAPLPALTANYSGFVNGDSAASLDNAVTLSTSATGGAVGSFAIVPAGAADANYAITFVNGTLTVAYVSGGACLGQPGHQILDPINASGASVFNAGRTVPAKFRVCDANGASVGAAGTVSSFRLTQVLAGTAMTPVDQSVDSTSSFDTFRWDPIAQQWIFNISTKELAPNRTYVFRISLNDGSAIDFRFGLR